MNITQEQAIKMGFLYACAEAGLTIPETHQRVKQAIAKLKQTKQAGFGLNLGTAVDAVPKLLSLAGGALVGAPVVAGMGGGYLAAKLTNPDDSHMLDDVKQDEIMGEYERLSDEAKRRSLLKRIQAQTGKKVVPLMPSLDADT
jgi:hypothetical protein